jgi:hypothetical protein
VDEEEEYSKMSDVAEATELHTAGKVIAKD